MSKAATKLVNSWEANFTVQQLLTKPFLEVNHYHLACVKLWGAKHFEYVTSITSETPSRVQAQYERNVQMQVQVTGLLSMLGNNDTLTGAACLRQNANNRTDCYHVIADVVEKCLKHLVKVKAELQ